MAFIGAGGKQFMSSVLAKASMPGGYQMTTYYPGGNPNIQDHEAVLVRRHVQLLVGH
jgi:ribosomal protein S12